MSKILFVIEIGGFPLNFDELINAGHEVEYINSMRKAIPLLKKFQPDVMVAEFQYTSQFRDRDSNLDTIMTQVVSRSPHTHVIALVEEEQQSHFERLKSRFDNIRDQLYFPFEGADLNNAIINLLHKQET
ncbi:MAG: hypothetical protein OQL16_07260 [Gammaproteobacteria bacterium]|nr:hypothetical protein [Gammaproteobacteria bacterium]